jgi:Coenzyme PQQ synthesis protein D (PqqD)
MNYSINKEEILFTQLGNEGVVFGIKKNEYLSLNETFFLILKGIEEGKSIDEIIEHLISRFDVDPAECRKQVLEALNQLIEKEFVVRN